MCCCCVGLLFDILSVVCIFIVVMSMRAVVIVTVIVDCCFVDTAVCVLHAVWQLFVLLLYGAYFLLRLVCMLIVTIVTSPSLFVSLLLYWCRIGCRCWLA